MAAAGGGVYEGRRTPALLDRDAVPVCITRLFGRRSTPAK